MGIESVRVEIADGLEDEGIESFSVEFAAGLEEWGIEFVGVGIASEAEGTGYSIVNVDSNDRGVREGPVSIVGVGAGSAEGDGAVIVDGCSLIEASPRFIDAAGSSTSKFLTVFSSLITTLLDLERFAAMASFSRILFWNGVNEGIRL